MTDPPADGCRYPQQLLGRLVEPGDALQYDVTDHRREIVTAAGGNEFLGKEWVAVCAADDPVEEPGRGFHPENLPDHGTNVVTTERPDTEPLGATGSHEFPERGPEPCRVVEFGRPARCDHEDRCGSRRVRHEQQ